MSIMGVDEPARLAIVGTRVLACDGDVGRVAERVQRAIEKLRPAVIISGGAFGVDLLAEVVAKAAGYREDAGTLLIFRPTVRRFRGPGGYRERDLRIAAECTRLLRLSCRQAKTYGSGWTADQAERMGKIVIREQVCQ